MHVKHGIYAMQNDFPTLANVMREFLAASFIRL